MADKFEKPNTMQIQTVRSVRKHTRERFLYFLKFVEKNNREIESSACEETEDEISEAESKKRRLNSDLECSSDELNSERNKEIFKGNKCKQKKGSQDETATNRLSNTNTDMNSFVECDSDIDEVECEESYWLENEVVFVSADQRETPLEFIVKKEK